ncbi:MAG: aminoglycoside adenylyltransferase family protein [Coriobacteriia bacterium]|nr:aminoglycoside adenylyltransferase family protein [Coriobacteriia bacterium]
MSAYSIPAEALCVLDILHDIFGESMIAAYLHGSAVLGGLKSDSDIDVLAVVNEPLPDDVLIALASELMRSSGRIGNIDGIRHLDLSVVKLSDIVPWVHPPRVLFQYGEWLRKDFESGWIPQVKQDPDLTIILKQAEQHSVTLLGTERINLIPPIPKSDLFKALKDVIPGLVGQMKNDERNVLLTLARIWATVATGMFMAKSQAAEWVIERLPQENTALLALAKDAYCGNELDDWNNTDLTEIVEIMTANIDEAFLRCW